MFDVGWTEILVIAIVLIVVVGPKDLPKMLRQFGRTTAKMRAMAGDFRKQFDEALKEAELDDVRDLAKQAKNLDPRETIRKHLNPLEKAGQDIKAGLDAAMKPKADSPAEASAAAVPETPVATPAKAVSAGKAKTASTSAKGTKSGTKKPATADAKATKVAASPKRGVAKSPAEPIKAPPAKTPAATQAASKKKTAPAVARKARATPAPGKQDKPGSAT